ncbi:hypothetical protein [Kamptonema formosum]|uniref:hypothetical protein n=1 Tax=Kamptonema formosum TaxID=331992 RepID=UPI00034AFF64|nr:hypothetical protein [Oscillatoria sp. PCC 10802]
MDAGATAVGHRKGCPHSPAPLTPPRPFGTFRRPVSGVGVRAIVSLGPSRRGDIGCRCWQVWNGDGTCRVPTRSGARSRTAGAAFAPYSIVVKFTAS